jgi:hypothetical protein
VPTVTSRSHASIAISGCSFAEGQQRLTSAVRDAQCNVPTSIICQRVDLVDVSGTAREMSADIAKLAERG